ncbi:MAG: hypothetical protein J7J88_01445 [Dehalococcoidia bacterium]|nr:hypothetical protein [Dehalococcoidia bacterium]
MKLTRVSFEHAMEMEGSMAFPEGKTVVIYGENKAGKSNIIHALRYAFLSKVIRPRKNPGYDELKLVTTREIAPAEGVGKISVEFEHEGKHFEIRREVDQHKDANKLLQTEATGPREIDFNSTISRELKAGLLDALFAPDSAMGFKHLNEKNIDAVIRELFKETGNAKVLAKDFKERTERLREEAQTRVSTIEKDYESFVGDLKSKLEELSIDVGNFASYEPGKTCDRINDVAERLKRHIDSLERGELKTWLESMKRQAAVGEDIEASLQKGEKIKQHFEQIKEIRADRKHLATLESVLRQVRRGNPMPPEPESFHDTKLDNYVKNMYREIKEAQARYANAMALAQLEKIDFNENPARIKGDKEKVLQLLTRKISTTDAPRIRVDLVKIDNSVHALIPLQMMDKDPAFTRLSAEPIPDAPEEDKRQYVQALSKKIANIARMADDKNRAENFFSGEFIERLSKLSRYQAFLMNREREEQEKISNFTNTLSSKLTLLTHEHIEILKLESEEDVKPFLSDIAQIASRKNAVFLKEINDRVRPLNIQASRFTTHEVNLLLQQLTDMEKAIPLYRNIWMELTRQERGRWERNDAEHVDLTHVPAVADGMDKTLDAILDNAFEEQELVQGMQEIIMEINDKLAAEGLINSRIEIGEGSLRLSKTTYKDREITHPCGAERSFFSLATLTALATYFQLPVIIDEAANNLDKNHLQHFVSLVKEFAANYDVQYILSVKETADFPLDGWVRDFADDLQVYRVEYNGKQKQIKEVDLYS